VTEIVADLTPVNRRLLRQRDTLQAAIDAWHRANAGQAFDAGKYRSFLAEIGYLAADPGPFQIATEGVDSEGRVGGRPAARGAGDQRQVRDQRGQRALGVAVRRVLRHRRDPRGPAGRRGEEPTIPSAASG